MLAVVYSGALSAGIANVVVLNGIGQLGPTRVTALQTLVPALAVVLAFIVLGEPIRLGQVVGGAIIVAASRSRGSATAWLPGAGGPDAMADVAGARRPIPPLEPGRRRWPSSSTTTARSR